MVQGTADDIVPQESVKKLVDKLSHQRGITIDYRLVEGANHFFTGQLDEMIGHVDNYLDKALVKTEA